MVGLGEAQRLNQGPVPDRLQIMADPAQFGHDRLGHLLSDRLLS